MSADLYGQDGKPLGHAQVDGAADSVLSLVDELSLSLVREIWRSKEPVPSLRVSGLTTTSLAAMREYLVGEQHYRRSEWDSAAAAFTRAIEQDSTFALAHYRLASSVGWSGGLTAVDALKAGDAALRFSDRLPPREQTLVRAYNLFQHQRLAATDSARAYVRKYPDDVDGWFLLGETQYHTRELVGYDPATLRAPFDSVLARDSTLTPASIHPIEIAVQSRDKPAYERYLRVLESSGNAQENLAYLGAGEMVFGQGVGDSATAAAMTRYGGTLGAVLGGLYAGEITGDSVTTRFDRWQLLSTLLPAGGEEQYLVGKGITLGGLGRLRAAEAIADTLTQRKSEQGQAAVMLPLLLGFAPPAYQPPAITGFLNAPRSNPFQVYLVVIFALNRGERAEGARLSDSLLAHQSPNMPPQFWELVRAAKGWSVMMGGDSTAGILAMRTALENVGGGWNPFLTAPLRLQLAAALAQRPATREQGRQILEYGFTADVGVAPIALYALGRAEEAAGNRSAAAAAYGQFLRLWDKADPMLLPRITEVREALKRVTGEGK